MMSTSTRPVTTSSGKTTEFCSRGISFFKSSIVGDTILSSTYLIHNWWDQHTAHVTCIYMYLESWLQHLDPHNIIYSLKSKIRKVIYFYFSFGRKVQKKSYQDIKKRPRRSSSSPCESNSIFNFLDWMRITWAINYCKCFCFHLGMRYKTICVQNLADLSTQSNY